jgi:hypothetical protein
VSSASAVNAFEGLFTADRKDRAENSQTRTLFTAQPVGFSLALD